VLSIHQRFSQDRHSLWIITAVNIHSQTLPAFTATCPRWQALDTSCPCSVLSAGIVLLLGTTAWQRKLICQELERINAELIPPADITADVPAWQRLQLYQEAAQQQPQQAQQQQQQEGQQSAVQIPGHDVQQQQQQEQQERQGQEQQVTGTALAPGVARPSSGATTAADADADAAAAVGSDAPTASAAAAEGPNSSTSQKKCAACFVTTRILVVDILSNRIRPQQIAGKLHAYTNFTPLPPALCG